MERPASVVQKLPKMIQTFIFFDLETCGLIANGITPKITEMSLVAVSRNEICNSNEDLPRVLHKLVLPINPRAPIPERVSSFTKLSNENLKDVEPFVHGTYDLMMSFIQRLAKPVCVVAHNGNAFDYPIILQELHYLDKLQDFDNNILSIDTLCLFRHFFSLPSQPVNDLTTPSTSLSSVDFDILMNDGNDKALCEALDVILTSDLTSPHKNQTTDSERSDLSASNERKQSVAKSECTVGTPQTSCYKKIQRINEKTPESQVVKSGVVTKETHNREKTHARRKLDFMGIRPQNFKLSTIYKHIFNSAPQNAHSAEGDCLIMLRCACQLGSFFVEYADNNAVPLKNFKHV